MVKIANLKKNSNWYMRQTPWQMHMYDIVTIDTIVFEIVRGEAFKAPPPPPRIANFLKYPGSDRVKTDTCNTLTLLSHKPEYNKLRQI